MTKTLAWLVGVNIQSKLLPSSFRYIILLTSEIRKKEKKFSLNAEKMMIEKRKGNNECRVSKSFFFYSNEIFLGEIW